LEAIQPNLHNSDILWARSRGAGEEPQDTAEVGISYTVMQNRLSVRVEACFLRHLLYAGKASICAQLNVFTLVGENVELYYDGLFENASLAELDNALRQGTISPFHIDEYGDNLCLTVSSVPSSLLIKQLCRGELTISVNSSRHFTDA
jgi:hypothetical protein